MISPQAYADYQRETQADHIGAFDALMLGRGASIQAVYDIGCGETPLIRSLIEGATYYGVDKAEANFLIQKDRVRLLKGIGSIKADLVTSTFATEVFMPALARFEFYTDIFRACKSVQRILVSGVCYPYEPHIEIKEEPFPHFVSSPYPFSTPFFTEEVFIHNVKSKLFGCETEVWRLLTRVA